MSPIAKLTPLALALAALVGCAGAMPLLESASGTSIATQGHPAAGGSVMSRPSASPSATTASEAVITSYGGTTFRISLAASGTAHYALSSANNAVLTQTGSVPKALTAQFFQDLASPIPTQAPGTVECMARKRDYLTVDFGSQHFSSQICGGYWPDAIDTDVKGIVSALGLAASPSPAPSASPTASPSASPSPAPSPSAS